ncbi:MAG: ABC transporter substrate-binding protein [Chloroflexi bacterium]|nr:ABC transporter substrate-binding protein [Chloroflexota bacterium]
MIVASPSAMSATDRHVSRRRFLAALGTIGMSAGLASLAGCAPAAQPAPAAPAAQPTSKPATQPTAAPAVQPTKAPAAQATAAPAATSKPATQGGTLVVAGEAVGDNYVPPVSFQGWAGVWVLNNVYDGLYTFRDFKTLMPALATGHTVSKDGLTYTFQLRKDVKFHDGTPFNAEAVEFNYMRYLDKSHPFYDENAIGRTALLPGVKSVKAKDELTVEIVRDKPMSAFIAALAGYQGGIMSPTAVKKAGVKDAGRNPVGTGPFAFEKAEKGVQASMKANEEYWGGRPPLDRIVVRAIADEQAMTASLLSGEVDLTPFIDFKDLESFRKNANLKVQVVPAASTGYMGMNLRHETMKDVRVRRALAHAINKQKIIDVVFYGEADIAAGLVPLPMWAYAPQFKDYYKYDPQKAKDLLKEAGVTPEFVLHTQSSGFWPRMAELMQADFNAAGAKVTIEKMDSGKFYGFVTEGKHAMFIGDGTPGTPDPEDQFWQHHGCDNPRHNRWGWCDAKFEEMRATQSAEQDQEKRKQILTEMQKVLLDNVVHQPNYYNRFATVMNKRVEGYSPLPIRSSHFEKTSVTKK